MHVQLIQHPVGQGGFFSGRLHCDGSPLRWVYDCGSNQRDALSREIEDVARSGPLDLLFLSHLDSDHVSGVDSLLSLCDVEEVVLPYLQDEVILATIARDSANGRLNGLFLDAAPDVAAWLAGRGVRTVTFIRGSGGGDDPEPAPPPLDPRRPEGRLSGDIHHKWVPGADVVREATALSGMAAAAPSATRVQVAESRAALQLSAGHNLLDWALIPHVHAPPDRLLAAFRNSLEEAFGAGFSVADIAAQARTEKGREALRRCYDSLWLDHNLVSMMLYAGPLDGFGLESAISYRGQRYGHGYGYGGGGVGWLLTGDAHLDGRTRREAAFSRYAPILEKVGLLMLPHHGSARNFHPDLIHRLPRLRIAFAAAGPNSYDHPSSSIRDLVRLGGRVFHQVSHRPGSRLVANVTP